MHRPIKSKVYLVGAGPGNPELLTLKAVRLLQAAEVVLYDRLIGEGILELVSPEAELIFVGKASGNHALPQPEINSLLIEKANENKMVVRLKGGDPFIFGRGGEEVLACREAGIPFEIVPGITAATAVGAYSGIPLTHRGVSPLVTFITGHASKSGTLPDIQWELLAKSNHTLVFYMGLSTLPLIAKELIFYGTSPDTPVAVVQEGSLTRQRTVTGILDNIVEKVEQQQLKSPALIIIGEVVKLREYMQWFEEQSYSSFDDAIALSTAFSPESSKYS